MYAWEIPFQKVIGDKRKDELKEVKSATIIRTVFLGFMIFTERATIFVTILTYILLGNVLSANVVSIIIYFIIISPTMKLIQITAFQQVHIRLISNI